MKFYTTPPKDVNYDYMLINPKTYKRLKYKPFKHAIADCGVLIFHDEAIKEYPYYFLPKWKYYARFLSDMYGVDRIWCTIPDYPDDYNPGQFGDNVEMTLKNVENFITTERVNWVISLQSRFLDIDSFEHGCQVVKERYGDYPRLAIGTVCKTNNLKFIKDCCTMARDYFPHSKLHAFGMTLTAYSHVYGIIDSWDSMAWTFPRVSGRGSAKNKVEREQFFYQYLDRIKKLQNIYTKRRQT